ncbi:hypothetical protein [Spiroplasma taiwanense]|uniref:Uncharacterized protein n=1 Tax=Spiroplasma taiwanense CT-1 TaxID=1276220 RepID=S5M0N2_9MOLU|nr:hypothetical protein [Spiroplasma taiwanense]AGR41562.1 hypothetical protein STAIW_v1c09760 [Spiroplasma taiwanense CT-1]
MNNENQNNVDSLQTKNNQNEQAKKRLDEIKKSNEIMGKNSESSNFFIPKRKNTNLDLESNSEIIKPRKRKNLPFTEEQKKEIEETVSNVKQEFKDIEIQNKMLEKKLVKEEQKLTKLIYKTSKKISNLLDKNKEDELEKTLELQDEYFSALEKIQDDIDTIVLGEANISLQQRRKHIYNNAYNAETERARRIIEMRKNRDMAWSNQIKSDSKKESPREVKSWKERLGLDDD